ncbi:hypothetical protein AB1Y20_023461 [Prymnesium parvum]|uniref:Uncharacterized protein n=1 Tax=Prymnesium parvum TaxID=97485 RepID=A0AB34JFH4_PRYPA
MQLLLTAHNVPARKIASELRRLMLSLSPSTPCLLEERDGCVHLHASIHSIAQLRQTTLPDRVYAVLLTVPAEQLPNTDAEIIDEVKRLVCDAVDWQSVFEAVGELSPQSADRRPASVGVTAKRAGKRFSSIPSQALAGSIGAALSKHFGCRVDLRSPELDVHASLNDDRLLLLHPLLRRPSTYESKTSVGLHPHVAWAMVKCAAQLSCPSLHSLHPLLRALPHAALPLIHAQIPPPRCLMSFSPSASIVVDPMCGSGSFLLELVSGWPSVLAMGSDASASQVALARRNRAALPASSASRLQLFEADSCRHPFRRGAADAVVTDLPFGKQHGSLAENASLYPSAVSSIADILRPGGCCVLLTNESNLQLLIESIRATHKQAILYSSAFESNNLKSAAEPGSSERPGPLRLICRRQVPLGFMTGWIVVARRESGDADTSAPQLDEVGAEFDYPQDSVSKNDDEGHLSEDGAVVRRFLWESQSGRASWDSQRKASRLPMEPACLLTHV